ncbi:unnamed protein product [Porites evermanni]|uniref:DUF4200 domain-containing protein n=1 Tax=Porites evermanni TaxID=104178 RepID=A0ABN8MFZ8_9CNID|nr:unnamed protein product [Porites evermanni]
MSIQSPSQGSNKPPRSGGQSASRQSEKAAFQSVKSSSPGNQSALSVIESVVNPNRNPFTIPKDNDVFMLRDRERQKKKQERINQRKLKVHEKTTYASRVNTKTAAMRKIADDSEDEFVEEEKKKEKDGVIAVKDDPQFTLAITRDRHVEKENLADFISKKREMFLVQYSLGVKRDEMRKLEEIAQAEEKKLELAEQYLEEDAAMFDEFLKENDKNSVEAIKIAEAETKLKLEKVAEIKKINAQMMAIKSEISKNEDTLKEYMLYKQFLDSLTPQEWKDEKRKVKEEKKVNAHFLITHSLLGIFGTIFFGIIWSTLLVDFFRPPRLNRAYSSMVLKIFFLKTKLSLTVRTDDFVVSTRNVDQHGHTVTSGSSGLLCYYFQLFCMIKRNSGYSFVLLSQKAKQKERGSVNKKKITRVAICVSRVLLDGLQKKERLLVVYQFYMMVEVKKQTNKKQKQQFLTIIIYPQKLSAHLNTSIFINSVRRNSQAVLKENSKCSLFCVLSQEITRAGRLGPVYQRSDAEDSSASLYDTDEEESDNEPELFFADPQQLLDIFAELEEQNLSLIQNSQETEEALEELRQTIKQTQDRMNRETEILKGQIDFLNDAINREEERAKELEMKSKMFSYGEFKAEDQEKMLQTLNKKVEEVYRNCIGDNEANISTLQMLTNIENRLEELFEQIEVMPPDRVEMAEKAKEKERRMRLREEKMEQQRLHQEDRVRRALERAQAEPKKKTGKPLMFRSEPPQRRRKQQDSDKKQDKEEEELKYFFT